MDLSSEKLNQIIILSRSLGKKGPMRFAEAHYLNLSIPHTAFLAFAFINAKFAHSKATTLRAQKKNLRNHSNQNGTFAFVCQLSSCVFKRWWKSFKRHTRKDDVESKKTLETCLLWDFVPLDNQPCQFHLLKRVSWRFKCFTSVIWWPIIYI